MLRTALSSLLLVSSASSQQLLHTFEAGHHRYFGYGIGPVGDINQDGHADFMVSCQLDDFPRRQKAIIYSGKRLNVLWTWFGGEDSQPGSGVAFSARSLGDVDRDGVDDFVISTPHWNCGTYDPYLGEWSCGEDLGAIDLFSGVAQPMTPARSLLRHWQGEFYEHEIGWNMEPVGDLNGDGACDLAVADPDWNWPVGRILVYSGQRQQPLLTISAAADWVCAPGDVTADGITDLIGSIGKTTTLYSGSDGSIVRQWTLKDGTGTRPAVLDLNGDGIPEVALSEWNIHTLMGRVFAYSCSDGALVLQLDGQSKDDGFGGALRKVGDIDGDGSDDLLVMAQRWGGQEQGKEYIYSGRTHRLFDERVGTEELPIRSLEAVGDVNADGFDDYLAAWTAFDNLAGRAWLWGGDDLFLHARPDSAKAGDTLKFFTEAGEPGAPTMLVMTAVSGAPTFAPIATGSINQDGAWLVSATVPGGLAGLTMEFRSFSQNSGGGLEDAAPEVVAFR